MALTRWIERQHRLFSGQTVAILRNDLYAYQAFCETMKNKGMHFILVCKPRSHKTT